MSHGNNHSIRGANHYVGPSESVNALITSQRACQSAHGFIGHQVTNATHSIVRWLTESLDDERPVCAQASLLCSLRGVARKLGSAARCRDVGCVGLVQVNPLNSWLK